MDFVEVVNVLLDLPDNILLILMDAELLLSGYYSVQDCYNLL